MAEGVFLVGTDRGVGKTMIGVGLVALLRGMGVDATLMTPISTGGSTENATDLLARIGVSDPRRLVMPVTYETLASPFVAARVENRPADIGKIMDAYRELRSQGKFVVIEGGGLMVPITGGYFMVDLIKEFGLPTLIVGRTGRGTLNHCLLTLRMMLVMGIHPLGFILNGFGQYGDGFAEALNPEALRELAPSTPVCATLEWRPEYQEDFHLFVRSLQQHKTLLDVLGQLSEGSSRQ